MNSDYNVQKIDGLSELELENSYVKNIYNQIAPKFDLTRSYYWTCVKEFLSLIDKIPEKKVLDVGCGNGRYVKLFGSMETHCLDNSEELLKIVQTRYPHVQTICSDVTSLPYPDNTFDHLISIAVIHHLSSESRRISMLEEIIRVMKIGGTAIITAWATSTPTDKFTKLNNQSDYLIPWAHQYVRFYHLFTEGEFETLISKSRFKNKIILNKVIFECDNWAIQIQKIE